MLKCGDNIVYGSRGELQTMYCKVCGDKIADTQMRPTRAGNDAPKAPKFTRLNNYGEAKIKTNYGAFHVTAGCRSCIGTGTSMDTFTELFHADLGQMGMMAAVDEVVVECVTVDYTGQGII